MTVVVLVPGQEEPWKVANSAFRQLLDEVLALHPEETDREVLFQAQALQILDLTAMSADPRNRLAGLLAQSARRLRRRLDPPSGAWEAEFIASLSELEMWMEGLTSDPTG